MSKRILGGVLAISYIWLALCFVLLAVDSVQMLECYNQALTTISDLQEQVRNCGLEPVSSDLRGTGPNYVLLALFSLDLLVLVPTLLIAWALFGQKPDEPFLDRTTYERGRKDGKRWTVLQLIRDVNILSAIQSWLFVYERKQALCEQKSPTAIEKAQAALTYLTELQSCVSTLLSEDELRALCSNLGVEYDSLEGSSKTDKVRELVLLQHLLGGQQCFKQLIGETRAHLPEDKWPEVLRKPLPEQLQQMDAKNAHAILTQLLSRMETRWNLEPIDQVGEEAILDLARHTVGDTSVDIDTKVYIAEPGWKLDEETLTQPVVRRSRQNDQQS
jgi:hypothetical protein